VTKPGLDAEGRFGEDYLYFYGEPLDAGGTAKTAAH
jgi:hypothetical protein